MDLVSYALKPRENNGSGGSETDYRSGTVVSELLDAAALEKAVLGVFAGALRVPVETEANSVSGRTSALFGGGPCLRLSQPCS